MISKEEYSTIVKNNSPKSKCFVNGTKAFFIGGFICLIGQVLTDCYSMLDLSKDDAQAYLHRHAWRFYRKHRLLSAKFL